MKFHGSITFAIADEKNIDVDFGVDIMPTKTVKRGDVILGGRKAPENRWKYILEFGDEEEYYRNLERMINQLCEKSDYVK